MLKNTLFILAVLFSTPSFADDKKSEKEKKSKVIKTPLKKILEMMKDVEERLNDADTGGWTQEEQKSVVEALKLQKDAQSELDDLIDKIQRSSGSGAGNKPGVGKGKNGMGLAKERKEKSSSEQAKEKKQQSKASAEEQSAKGGTKNKPRSQEKKLNKSLPKDESPANRDSSLDVKKKSPWGNLPQKLHQDVERARKEEVPEKWRDLIEGYRKIIND